MNEAFVIKFVTKYLDNQRKIREDTFNQIFSTLDSEQQQNISHVFELI